MADLKSITALEALFAQIAGKHESTALQADLALAGTAVSLLAQSLIPNLAPSLNLTAIDAGLAKAFGGITDTISAAETPITAAPAANTEATTNG